MVQAISSHTPDIFAMRCKEHAEIVFRHLCANAKCRFWMIYKNYDKQIFTERFVKILSDKIGRDVDLRIIFTEDSDENIPSDVRARIKIIPNACNKMAPSIILVDNEYLCSEMDSDAPEYIVCYFNSNDNEIKKVVPSIEDNFDGIWNNI